MGFRELLPPAASFKYTDIKKEVKSLDSFIELFKDKIQTDTKLTKKQYDILNACVDLFAEKGFANTSTSDIAKKANVAEGTIFKHFGTKQNLLYATVLPIFSDVVFANVLNQLQAGHCSDKKLAFADLIHHILFDQFNLFNDNYKIIKIFASEMMYQQHTNQTLLAMIPAEVIETINQLLDHYKKSGEIVDWDNQSIMRLIMAPILSYVFVRNNILPKTQQNDARELKYIETFIIKGLTK